MSATLPVESSLAWTIGLSISHSLAIGSTVYRLYHRIRTQRTWLDDWLLLAALPVDVLYFIGLWLRNQLQWTPTPASVEVRVVLYWIGAMCYFTVLWFSRISMALSTARIFPPGHGARRTMLTFAIFFGLLYVGLTIQTITLCANSSWFSTITVQCTNRTSGNVAWVDALAGDLIADTVLVVVPIVVLWRVDLPPNQRRLILAVMASGILTSMSSIALFTFFLGPNSWNMGSKGYHVVMMSNLEASVSLLVSNLLVVTTVYYRYFKNGEDLEASHSSASSRPTLAEIFTISTAPRSSNFALTRVSAPTYTESSISMESTGPGHGRTSHQYSDKSRTSRIEFVRYPSETSGSGSSYSTPPDSRPGMEPRGDRKLKDKIELKLTP